MLSSIAHLPAEAARKYGDEIALVAPGRRISFRELTTARLHTHSERDTAVTALPCAHVHDNVVIIGAVQNGSTLVLHPRLEEATVLESIQEHRATLFDGVPAMYMFLLNHPELDGCDLSSLRCCVVGGQKMPVPKMQEVGARSADVEQAGTTLPLGEVGELMIKGGLVLRGCYGNEQATKDAIESDGWLRTGDLATMDEDGCIFIVDRKKDMILTAGYNIYPAELERVISGHPVMRRELRSLDA